MVMFVHCRSAIVAEPLVMLVIMLRATVLPVIPRAVMSSMMPGRNVFLIVVAVTIAVVPIYFVVDVVFVHSFLIAIAVAVSRQRRTRSQENQRNQNYQ